MELPVIEGTKSAKIGFDLSFNLGHLFVVFSLFLSAAGLYAHDESRLAIVETKVHILETSDLPSRVAVIESRQQNILNILKEVHQSLIDIRDQLADLPDTIRPLRSQRSVRPPEEAPRPYRNPQLEAPPGVRFAPPPSNP